MEGGQWVNLRSPTFQAEVGGQLARLSALVQSYGARLVLLSAPYYANGTPNDIVDSYNTLLAQVPDAQILSLHDLLDPADRYTSVVDGIVARDVDGVHLTSLGTTAVMSPVLLPPIVAIGRQAQ